jgi:indolepyruvate ferredoxin oxidoreductase
MRDLVSRLTPANYGIAVEIASVPERIRGYGHIKRRHLAEVAPKQAELLAAFQVARPEVVAAE